MSRTRTPRGRTIALVGVVAAVVLAVHRWQDIAASYQFYQVLEPLGKNDQGYREYRHRQTGIVMVRVPGGTFMMGTSAEDVRTLPTPMRNGRKPVSSQGRHFARGKRLLGAWLGVLSEGWTLPSE